MTNQPAPTTTFAAATPAEPDLLAELLEGARSVPPPRADGVLIGRVAGWTESDDLIVEVPGLAGGPRPAQTVVALRRSDVGRAAVLMFEDGRLDRPIVVGLLQPAGPQPDAPVVKIDVTHDGKRLEFAAEQEIVLRCGEASITLTRAGKVLIRGAYVSSRSSGQNDIKGASIHIN